jgi:hypothetical protein
MPVLILSATEYLHELFEDGGLTAITPLGEASRVVVMAVHPVVMLIVTVLGTKRCGAHGAGKVVNVIFTV